jgi:thiol:disulfide interchange protein DsbD
MKVNFKLLILLLLLVAPVAMFAQADTTTNKLEGLEFTDGTISPDSLSFEESPDTVTVKADSNKTTVAAVATGEKAAGAEKKSLWSIFIAGLIGGFAALLMPCIFPMLPLAVSYFTKQAGSRASGISKALLYGLFIIVIYSKLSINAFSLG